MSKQRRTADDFVRDMKAKQQHSTPATSSAKPTRALLPNRQARGAETESLKHNGRQLGGLVSRLSPSDSNGPWFE